MRFEGRVVMKRLEEALDIEAAKATEHGAGGLILVQSYLPTRERELYATDTLTDTLPVVLIAQDTWTEVLKLAGLEVYEANTAPPALLMGLEVDLAVPIDLDHQAVARDVVGVLPEQTAGRRAAGESPRTNDGAALCRWHAVSGGQ